MGEAVKTIRGIYADTNEPEKCEALKTAISALEKQVPKKVLKPLHECSQGTCPICYAIQFKMSKFCYNCGQKIDWELI